MVKFQKFSFYLIKITTKRLETAETGFKLSTLKIFSCHTERIKLSKICKLKTYSKNFTHLKFLGHLMHYEIFCKGHFSRKQRQLAESPRQPTYLQLFAQGRNASYDQI